MWLWTTRFGGVTTGRAVTGRTVTGRTVTGRAVTAVTGMLVIGAAVCAAHPAQAAETRQVTPLGAAAARGVSVEIVEVPDRFVAGAAPETITVVASKSGGGDCLKVRWSMVLRVEGLSLEQVRVDRIEESGSFPVDVDDDATTARVTDEQLDPGTLCRNRTVTARYRLNVANDVQAGRLAILAEAYDADARLLERDGAARQIVGTATAPRSTAGPSAEPSAGPTPDESPTTDPAAGTGAGAAAPGDTSINQTEAGNDQNGIPLAWFFIGGLMMFLGLSLLFNLRRRQRSDPEPVLEPALPGRLSRYRTVPRRARRGW